MPDTLSAGREFRICKLCYNSQRALFQHFKKRGQRPQWEKMPHAKKKRLIIANKGTGGVRGKERVLDLSESVTLINYALHVYYYTSYDMFFGNAGNGCVLLASVLLR